MKVNMFTITIECSRTRKTIVLFTLNRVKVEDICNILVPPTTPKEDVAMAQGKSRMLIEQFIEDIRQ